VIEHFRIEKQGFSRNAADVQAGPTKVWVFFDQGRGKAKLAGANGGGVSSRTAADDGYVVNGVSHLGCSVLQKVILPYDE
jgi:hypothetical protein